MGIDKKRTNGQYYTRGNPFKLKPFKKWASKAQLENRTVLEPFAGANHIIRALQSEDLCNGFLSFDINPADGCVRRKDTIESFPTGFDACVTNPPWLARNSATRRGLLYPDTSHDDLYKHCLELCLKHCEYVAALIPASYLQSGLFRDRLRTYILLHDDTLFSDTANPVCLALFDGTFSEKVEIYYDNERIGKLSTLESKIPQSVRNKNARFNDTDGCLGFISFDNTRNRSIRFCDAREIKDYSIKVSSRFITRISGNFDTSIIDKLNEMVDQFREGTHDLFLTPFKGIRSDGSYRRRMSFALARRLIDAV